MLNRCVGRSQWGALFDRITAGHADVPGQATARLQVDRPAGDGPREGSAHDGAWRPFVGVSWDPEEDTITVALEGLDHAIRGPLVLWADADPRGEVRRLLVLGGPGHRDEVAFKMAGLRGRGTP